MPYQVFDNGKPADTTGYPELAPCWHTSQFDYLEDAIQYARRYFYPFSYPTYVGEMAGYDGTGEIREVK